MIGKQVDVKGIQAVKFRFSYGKRMKRRSKMSTQMNTTTTEPHVESVPVTPRDCSPTTRHPRTPITTESINDAPNRRSPTEASSPANMEVSFPNGSRIKFKGAGLWACVIISVVLLIAGTAVWIGTSEKNK